MTIRFVSMFVVAMLAMVIMFQVIPGVMADADARVSPLVIVSDSPDMDSDDQQEEVESPENTPDDEEQYDENDSNEEQDDNYEDYDTEEYQE
ncbi:MAG TPA: hypothetical protein VKQ10_03000 [Spirochaetota bacterium]|nr:hypothetical protein [Spirochaetota bacterium]